MKKIVLSVVFILTFFLLNLNKLFAQEEMILKEPAGFSDTITKSKIVEYTLPYPGILPDNPLYFLKVARDRIVSLLISDPLKKAEFNLLQADKRLNTGIYLFNKDKSKISLSQSTISKGENYFEDAIKSVREAKEQGMETNDMLRRLSDSSYKHQEVLKSLEKKAPYGLKASFVALQERAGGFEKQVDILKSKR